jgi:hypothetical protein
MLYAAKCYWPGVSQSELERVADLAARSASAVEPSDVAYRGSLLFAADDLVLCLFEASLRAEVNRESEQLGIPCERVMDCVWLGPSVSKQQGARNEQSHTRLPRSPAHRKEAI